jgi:hypothetical protein
MRWTWHRAQLIAFLPCSLQVNHTATPTDRICFLQLESVTGHWSLVRHQSSLTSRQELREEIHIYLRERQIWNNQTHPLRSSRIPMYFALSLFSLPIDLLQFIFTFLSVKELCYLDSAILNCTDRPHLLATLARSHVWFGGIDTFMESKTKWFLCRRVHVTDLYLHKVPCPNGLISFNSNYLQQIACYRIVFNDAEFFALTQCSRLKKIDLDECSFPVTSEISLIFQNFTNLEELRLQRVPFTRSAVEAIARYCQSLKYLEISYLDNVGDDELRCLVYGCPYLRTLKLCGLDITDESTRMLFHHGSQIRSVGINDCTGVRSESVLSLLREFNIPQIFNHDIENLQISALEGFTFSIPFSRYSHLNLHFIDFLSQGSLLKQLAEFFSLENSRSLQITLILFFSQLTNYGYSGSVVESGVVSKIIPNFSSFDDLQRQLSIQIFQELSSDNYHRHLLSSGILSIVRSHLLQVRTLIFDLIELLKILSHLSQEVFTKYSFLSFDRMLVSLSFLIPASLVPIDDWISTVSFLIEKSFGPVDTNLHSTIYSICMGCSSPSHVGRLVNEGLLSYWDRAVKEVDGIEVMVHQAILHFTSIDQEFKSKVPLLSIGEHQTSSSFR